MAFKIGDVVQLKSGGPAMTVSGEQDGEVVCDWFEKAGTSQARKSGTFHPETLKPYTPPGFAGVTSRRG